MGYLAEGRVVRGLEGDYHVERRLAKTRHHTLFTARGRGDRVVLLKELHANDIRDWSDIERLRAEARLLSDVRHPRVPDLVDLFATNGAEPHEADRFTERFVRAPEGTLPEGGARPDLPSLVLVRGYVGGETAEESAARGRPFTPQQIEDMLRDLLGLVASLHAMVPEVVHGEIEASRVVIDTSSRAHLIGFGAGASRRKRSSGANEPESVKPIDDARAIARVIERLVGPGGVAKSGLSTRAVSVIEGLVSERPKFASARDALAVLADPPPPSFLRRMGRSKVLRGVTLALVSVSVHGVILGSVVRASTRKAELAARAATVAAPKEALRPALVPLAPAPQPPPAKPPNPPPVFWTGQVLESGAARAAKGAPCVMTADVSGSDRNATCSLSLTCGGEVIFSDRVAGNCEVIEQAVGPQTYQYRLKATQVGPESGLSFRIDHGTAFVLDGGARLHVKLAPTSNPQKWSDGRRLTSDEFAFAQPSELGGVAVKVQGDASVHSGDHCTVRFSPLADDPRKNCHVKVDCRGNVLYERDDVCTSDGEHVTSYGDGLESVFDGDASFVWSEQLVTIEDLTATARKHVEIYMLEPKPTSGNE